MLNNTLFREVLNNQIKQDISIPQNEMQIKKTNHPISLPFILRGMEAIIIINMKNKSQFSLMAGMEDC